MCRLGRLQRRDIEGRVDRPVDLQRFEFRVIVSSHWDGDNGGRVFCAETRGGGGVAHGDEFAGEGEVDGGGGEGAGCGGDD